MFILLKLVINAGGPAPRRVDRARQRIPADPRTFAMWRSRHRPLRIT